MGRGCQSGVVSPQLVAARSLGHGEVQRIRSSNAVPGAKLCRAYELLLSQGEFAKEFERVQVVVAEGKVVRAQGANEALKSDERADGDNCVTQSREPSSSRSRRRP